MNACAPARAKKADRTARGIWIALAAIALTVSSSSSALVQYNSGSAIPTGAAVITAVTSFAVTSAMLDRLPQLPGFNPSLIEVTADASGAPRLFVIGDDSRRIELTIGTDGRLAILPAPYCGTAAFWRPCNESGHHKRVVS